MGAYMEFDWAMSIEVDNTVGDDRKSSKTLNANESVFALVA
jgi:hypothetical protein